MEKFSPGQSLEFDELFQAATTKSEVIVTFLAVLELMKLNQFVIRQDSLLSTITVERCTATQMGHEESAETEFALG